MFFRFYTFESLLEFSDCTLDSIIIDEIKELSKEEINDNSVTMSPLLKNMLAKFEEYENDTTDGLHGKTSQYYAIYVRMIDNYLLLTRRIRTGDFDLFKFV